MKTLLTLTAAVLASHAASYEISLATSASYEDIIDAAVWMHPSDAKGDLLVSTQEADGFSLYDATGSLIQHFDELETYGADIRYDMQNSNGQNKDVLALAHPEEQAIAFYQISGKAPYLQSLGRIALDHEPAGLCLSKNPSNQDFYATSYTESGIVSQYKLQLSGEQITSVFNNSSTAKAVREIIVGGEVSACAIDDQQGILYLAEEELGIWSYGSDPENVKDRELVDAVAPLGNLNEVEGLDVVHSENGNLVVVGDEVAGFLIYNQDNELIEQIQIEYVEEGKQLISAQAGIWLANTELDEPVYNLLPYSQISSIDAITSHRSLSSGKFALVPATAETKEVDDDGDAADDSVVWVNPKDHNRSLIIATNKQGGLMAYNLTGYELQYHNEGEPNNVDLRTINGRAIATASNRDDNSISVYEISDSNTPITLIGSIATDLDEIYGACMYQNGEQTYAIVNDKNGRVQQYEMDLNSKALGKLVREFKLDSQPEGCVADDKHQVLYVGEEDLGIWKLSAKADSNNDKTLIAKTDGVQMTDDVEGIALYQTDKVNLLFASSQGDNSYSIFDINDNYRLIGQFAVINNRDSSVDGASDTDGIAINSQLRTDEYPQGIFVAQDWYNINEDFVFENQNFKMVSMQDIFAAFK